MAESPVAVEKVDCGNGKRKFVVREREYDLRSWQGIKTLITIMIAVGGVIVAVLTAYYTAEASQTADISSIQHTQVEIRTNQQNSEKTVANALEKIDRSLTEQRKLIDETRSTLIRIDTRQEAMKEQVDKLADEIKKPNP